MLSLILVLETKQNLNPWCPDIKGSWRRSALSRKDTAYRKTEGHIILVLEWTWTLCPGPLHVSVLYKMKPKAFTMDLGLSVFDPKGTGLPDSTGSPDGNAVWSHITTPGQRRRCVGSKGSGTEWQGRGRKNKPVTFVVWVTAQCGVWPGDGQFSLTRSKHCQMQQTCHANAMATAPLYNVYSVRVLSAAGLGTSTQ